MTLPDDSTLTPSQLALVRKHADRILEEAGAYGRFPTPVDDIIEAAHLEVAEDVSLDEGFLQRFYRKAKRGVLRAVGKVLGLFDSRFGTIYLDQTVHPKKKLFIKLHETGHGFMPHQRDTYSFIEDSKHTLDPDVKEAFDREANAFASEVMFQCGAFDLEAADHALGIKTPLNLSKKYGSSVYAAIRRYVRSHGRACAVVVLERPEFVPGDGLRVRLRRVETSRAFVEQFGDIQWPQYFTPDDPIGASVPSGKRRFSSPRECAFEDQNGDDHTCIAEAFDTTHNIFVLLYPAGALARSSIIVP